MTLRPSPFTLHPSIICLVTEGALRPGDDAGPTLRAIERAARAGIDLIQIRERGLDGRSLVALARAAVQAAAGTSARIVLNDRLDVALAAGAAGVHLRGDSIAAADARRLAPAAFIVGRSVHDAAEAAAAADAGGCDYLIFGTVFPSASKPGGPSAGVEALRAVAARVRLPVLAIGGVSAERAPLVARAGAAGIAAIGLFARSAALAEDVARVRRAFDT